MEAINQRQIEPKWEPVSSIDRRVMGVLVEKSKTTPDVYPMTINSLLSGCNQKSNRSPVMQLSSDDIEESLERLRHLGAVAEVQTSGRVPKYRHYLYDWIGVDRAEMAVMAELLLRGDQTMGELRARAARMEPIADLAALRPIVAALKQRKLVIPLSPEGRGHIVTHNLYKPKELEKLKARHGGAGAGETVPEMLSERTTPEPQPASTTPRTAHPDNPAGMSANASSDPSSPVASVEVAGLQQEVSQLRGDLDELLNSFEDLLLKCEQTEDELRQLKDSLGT